ncbi:hypothetical protein BBO99_00001093 [Phytophthora kernoviae]|uniref:PH domain-containing protein n=2 Tax=Phytophthora kernoviae TaxID=325452 RepID=A0A3R7J5V6_9STRA|nr:hypothetical protein G195_002630 [Phytophthora kernoviae 00238/432]KAG2532446.1 hypothetical protein JM16_000363 [Phytophthora kernoviae]RLN06726.1 hypothetical protein BBI17_001064 [Phytophthora kernoviae]RLN84778.1 hypothetical protein BBO99_00001093 [Phytophthora kernoviae]
MEDIETLMPRTKAANDRASVDAEKLKQYMASKQSTEALPGAAIRRDVRKDAEGFEDVDDFWVDEDSLQDDSVDDDDSLTVSDKESADTSAEGSDASEHEVEIPEVSSPLSSDRESMDIEQGAIPSRTQRSSVRVAEERKEDAGPPPASPVRSDVSFDFGGSPHGSADMNDMDDANVTVRDRRGKKSSGKGDNEDKKAKAKARRRETFGDVRGFDAEVVSPFSMNEASVTPLSNASDRTLKSIPSFSDKNSASPNINKELFKKGGYASDASEPSAKKKPAKKGKQTKKTTQRTVGRPKTPRLRPTGNQAGCMNELNILCRSSEIRLRKLPTEERGGAVVHAYAGQSFNLFSPTPFARWISGRVVLPPGAWKEPEGVGAAVQLFYVTGCQPKSLELALAPETDDDFFTSKHTTHFLLSPGDEFYVPAGNVYYVKNHSSSADCDLRFTILKPEAAQMPMDAVETIKEGTVAVRGHFIWRDRFVIIRTGEMIIRRRRDGAIKAKIDLLDTSVKLTFHGGQSLLTISMHGRDTMLGFRSSSTRDEWISAIVSAQEIPGSDADCNEDEADLLSGEETDDHTGRTRRSSMMSLGTEKSDTMEEDIEGYNDALIALQSVRDSVMQCHISMGAADIDSFVNPRDAANTTAIPNASPSQRRAKQNATRSEEELRWKRLRALLTLIESSPYGGRVVLLHLGVVANAGISVSDILLALGEKQRDNPRNGSFTPRSVSIQKHHIAAFVRDILFHPIYSKPGEEVRLAEPLRTVLWEISCSEMAEQLTIFHHSQLSNVYPWEFLHHPKEAAKEMTDHFNRLVAYFVWSVLVEDTPKDRAEVIEDIISIAMAASAPPLNNFHLDVRERVEMALEALLVDDRQPVTRFLHKFWLDFKHNVWISGVGPALQSIQLCVATMHKEVMTYKMTELVQISGLDENSVDLHSIVYEKIVALTVQPIYLKIVSKTKRACAMEDAHAAARVLQCTPHGVADSSTAIPCTSSSPIELLNLVCQLVAVPLHHDSSPTAVVAATDHQLAAVELLATLQHQGRKTFLATHPVSSLYLMHQILDPKYLAPHRRQALDVFAAAVRWLRKDQKISSDELKGS